MFLVELPAWKLRRPTCRAWVPLSQGARRRERSSARAVSVASNTYGSSGLPKLGRHP